MNTPDDAQSPCASSERNWNRGLSSTHDDIAVEIDDSGWFSEGAAIRYTVERNGLLRALAIRAPTAIPPARLKALNVLQQVDRYNALLCDVRGLRDRVTAIVRRRGKHQTSPVQQAHSYLARVDADITARQMRLMGNGMVKVSTLGEEIRYWERYYEHFSPIVDQADKEAS